MTRTKGIIVMKNGLFLISVLSISFLVAACGGTGAVNQPAAKTSTNNQPTTQDLSKLTVDQLLAQLSIVTDKKDIQAIQNELIKNRQWSYTQMIGAMNSQIETEKTNHDTIVQQMGSAETTEFYNQLKARESASKTRWDNLMSSLNDLLTDLTFHNPGEDVYVTNTNEPIASAYTDRLVGADRSQAEANLALVSDLDDMQALRSDFTNQWDLFPEQVHSIFADEIKKETANHDSLSKQLLANVGSSKWLSLKAKESASLARLDNLSAVDKGFLSPSTESDPVEALQPAPIPTSPAQQPETAVAPKEILIPVPPNQPPTLPNPSNDDLTPPEFLSRQQQPAAAEAPKPDASVQTPTVVNPPAPAPAANATPPSDDSAKKPEDVKTDANQGGQTEIPTKSPEEKSEQKVDHETKSTDASMKSSKSEKNPEKASKDSSHQDVTKDKADSPKKVEKAKADDQKNDSASDPSSDQNPSNRDEDPNHG